MKTSALIASIIGGIVVVGGGGVAAGIAISDDTPAIETVQPVETIDATHAPEPAASAEPVETSTPDPVESAGPVESVETPEPEPVLTGEEQMREIVEMGYWDYLHVGDDEIMSAAHYVCDQLDAGVPAESIVALTGPVVTDVMNYDFVTITTRTMCPA